MNRSLAARLRRLEVEARIGRAAVPVVTVGELAALPPTKLAGAYRRLLRGEIHLDVPPLALRLTTSDVAAMPPAERARAYRRLVQAGCNSEAVSR